MKKYLSIILAVLVLTTMLAGCGGKQNTPASDGAQASNGDAAAKTELTVALPSPFTVFHTLSVNATSSDEQICQTIHEPLYLMPMGAADPIMKLAESCEYSDDLLKLTFRLRDGIKFSDGTPVTSADVLYSYEKNAELQQDYEWAQNVTSFEAPDEKTFVINLAAYSPTFFENAITLVVPAGCAEDEGFNDAPVGCGPYKVESIIPGDSVVLTANENYYGEAPAIPQVTFKVMTSASANSISLETGEIQLSVNIPSADYDYLEGLENVAIGTYVSANLFDVAYFNNTVAPFDNADFRKAVCYATDRQLMIDAVFGGYGVEATTLCAAASPAYDASNAGYPYNLEKAAEYLAKAGYPNGEGLEPLTITVYTESCKTMAEILQSSLNQLGIKVEIEMLEPAAAAEKLYAGEIPFGIFGTGTATLHGSAFSEFYTGFFAPMTSHYDETANAEKVAALFEQAAAEVDTAKQNEIYRQIWQITDAEDAAYDPINYRLSVYAADAALDMSKAVEMVMAYGLNPYYMSYK